MQLETINKLYLELSQVATATTAKEAQLQSQMNEMRELLMSARAIAERKGEGTSWERFSASIAAIGIGSVTARTYRILESDANNV